MHTIDLVNLAVSRLAAMEIELRFVHGEGLSSGLCRLASRRILFLNDATSASEQLDVIAQAFSALDIDFSTLPGPLRVALQQRLKATEYSMSSAA